MHPSFASIRFGPFKGSYHKEAVNDDFKEALSAFLEVELLPQVDEPYDSTSGSLTATFDDQKYCGPHSAVRDIYTFEYAFHRQFGDDTIKAALVFDSKSRNFSTRYRRPFFLWTPARIERKQKEKQAIESICRRIANREQTAGKCPLCFADLKIIDSPGLFDVSCPEGCFNYNYHRDPATGVFLHGHFFTSPTVNDS